jgi:hypothetical protein
MQPELGPAERAIRAEIVAAFGHVPAARADEMLLDEYARNDDAQELAAAFGGRHWTELSIEELFWHRESVVALGGIGYRAYLPAYLAASLTDDRRHTPDIQEYMLFGLHPLSDSDFDVTTTRKRLSLLDEAQRRAVASVLSYLEDRWHTEPGEIVRDWK